MFISVKQNIWNIIIISILLRSFFHSLLFLVVQSTYSTFHATSVTHFPYFYNAAAAATIEFLLHYIYLLQLKAKAVIFKCRRVGWSQMTRQFGAQYLYRHFESTVDEEVCYLGLFDLYYILHIRLYIYTTTLTPLFTPRQKKRERKIHIKKPATTFSVFAFSDRGILESYDYDYYYCCKIIRCYLP